MVGFEDNDGRMEGEDDPYPKWSVGLGLYLSFNRWKAKINLS